ncbi:MAG TPA: chemotaxis protein CheB [Thermoanaerobaculia bacterium]|nr:chemotaxis protein CheB [Thermoanaerobaculia bacterium]
MADDRKDSPSTEEEAVRPPAAPEPAEQPEASTDEQGEKLTVVGIGASAGGLEPLGRFFKRMPPDLGVAYVVITHLSPEHRSSMPELLAKSTEMPVRQVLGTVPLERDHVYVIPPDRELLATDSSLTTAAFDEPRGQRVPIDHFFRSLAREHGDGFAIVLSGSGSDGSLGIRSIKEEGGIVLVQEPREADFGGMPQSAIATGCVDLVLPIEKLADRFVELVELKRRPSSLTVDGAELGDGEQAIVRRILAVLRASTGHDFSRYKRSTVLRRLARRMQINRCDAVEEYLSLLSGEPDEARRLLQELLISVTSFFRDPAAYEVLAEKVIEPLVQSRGEGPPIRIWIPGCATGEEAYSIAMLLHEAADRHQVQPQPQLEIFATDLDERALAIAREGRYPKAIETDVSVERLARFFVQRGEHYVVKPELRKSLLFACHNLLRDPPFHQIDLISCRNLLIYLDTELQPQVLSVLHYALAAGGRLFLGSADNADRERFLALDREHWIYEKRESLTGSVELPTLLAEPRPAGITSRPSRRPSPRTAIEAHRMALEAVSPPSALVDGASQVVHLSESAGRYLQPAGGPFTAEITELVRPELAHELRSSLFRVFRHGTPVLTSPLPVAFNGKAKSVSLQVLPRWREGSKERLALVLFLEGEEIDRRERKPLDPTDRDGVSRLREELCESQEQLRATREDYEAANEELRASNEELQSVNEEYRSTSEELETSKEELQSINEELHTVNNELKHKLEEVSSAHSDLENLIANTEIGTLFLDRELRIQRYSPKVSQLFAVIADDRGRPIGDFTHSLEYRELLSDCHRVLHELAVVEREVRSDDRRWFSLRLRPYRTVEDRIDGVVLTFFEITGRKRTELTLLEREAQLELAHQTAQVGWWTVDLDRGEIGWSDSARTLLGLEEGDEPATLQELAERLLPEEDRADFLAAFSEAGRERSEIELELRVRRADGSWRWLLSRGRLYPAIGDARLVAVLIDVTEQKRIQRLLEELDRQDLRGSDEREQAVARSADELHAMVSSLTQAEQEERRQLAQVLHDDLQQQLYGVRLRITELLRSTEGAAAADAERLAEIYDQLAEAIAITRRLAARLSLPGQGTDLNEVLDSLAQQMESLHELVVEVRHDGPPPKTGESLRIVVHQIVRELLFNVVKHSGVRSAIVTSTQQDGDLVLTIEDSGRGFDAEVAERGFGLQTVRRRLELLGGEIETVSRPGEGARVVVHIPLAAGSD